MGRLVSVLLLGLTLLLAGCTRNEIRGPDPLDWKIHAGDKDEVQQWLDENLPLMTPELAGEVAACVNNIKALTPLGPEGLSIQRDERFAHSVDGKTVRDLLVAGHEMANEMLVARINNESDKVLRLTVAREDIPDEQRSATEKRLKSLRESLAVLKQKLAEANHRLDELHAGAVKH